VYLLHHYEPDSKTELLRMQQRAKAYQVISNELYKTSVMGPLLCCLSKAEGRELLAEVHSGVCRGGTLVPEPSQQKSSDRGSIGPRSSTTPTGSLQHVKPGKSFHPIPELRPSHHTHHAFMAAGEMRHRHRETADNCTKKLQVCGGCSRVLYKVDRG
jgi:hypothetical protein